MKYFWKKFCEDNRGASLITVVVTVTFLAILGTMLIGAALVNYQMKQMDLRSKKDFYSVETVLDDVYNGLGRDMTKIIADSYQKALTETNAEAFATEEEAYEYLREEFTKAFKKLYDDAHEMDTVEFKDNLKIALNNYIVAPPTGSSAAVVHIGSVEKASDNSYVALRDVIVTYYNGTLDTASAITTDIVLTVPTIRMFDSHDYVWDYAVIGNEGVYVTGSSVGSTKTVIEGNVFGGSSTDSSHKTVYAQKDVYGGINVKNAELTIKGETITSGADFNINGAKVNLTGLSGSAVTNLWTGNLNVAGSGSEVNIEGNMFLNNDLEINGTDSEVTLVGSYYGYSDKSTTKESQSLGKDHAESSSILINGRRNVLNLEGLDLLLVSGRSYLDFEGHSNNGEYGTGEALSFITSQFIYMVPTEFLDFANPEKLTTVQNEIGVNGKVTHFSSANMNPAEWFGYKYVDSGNHIRQEIVEVSGDYFVYFFLDFDSEEDAKKYVNEILQATSDNTQAYEMKCRMQERVSVLLEESIILQGSGENCNVYSNFQVMQYTVGSGGAMGMIQAVASGSSSIVNTYTYASALNSRYSYLMDTLNPRMEVALDVEVSGAGLTYPDLPLGGIVYLNNSDGYSELSYNYSSSGLAVNDCYRDDIVRGGYTYDLIISDEDLNFNGLTNFDGVILTTGNVTLKNCNINGLVMAKGTVTLENSTVKANRELLQSLVEAEALEIDEAGIDRADAAHASYFIHYLRDPRYNGPIPYGKDAVGTDYTEFITYENWMKGAW